jgi:multidrug efflux system outer membrane protein
MKQYKFIAIFIILNLLINNPALCQTAKTTPQSPTPVLKASTEDAKLKIVNQDWWDKFNDPVLKGYVTKTIKDNHDLKIAAAKVDEANAIVQEYLGKEFPSVNLGFDYGRIRTSGNIASTSATTRDSFLIPLSANYELDLWRKNRDITKSKEKELEMAIFDEKGAYINICSNVATVYFNLTGVDAQIEVQKDIIELRQSILDMTKANYENGLSPTTDVILADKALTEARADLKTLQKQQSILSNQLAVLTGDSSDNSALLKRSKLDSIELRSDLPKTIESDVVFNRAIIKKTEAQLAKSKIDVALAKKDFLPALTITGQYGFNANSFSKSFDSNSYIASFGGSILQSVFTGGQKRARLKYKKFQYQEMLENYQKTILQTFQEVNDSLASLKFDTEKNNDYEERLKLERDNMGVINYKYSLGAISLLDTLQFKERVYVLEKDQIKSKADCLVDSISLYKSVAGRL